MYIKQRYKTYFSFIKVEVQSTEFEKQAQF